MRDKSCQKSGAGVFRLKTIADASMNIRLFTFFILTTAGLALLPGCAGSRDSQQGTSTTVSGYFNVGAGTHH